MSIDANPEMGSTTPQATLTLHNNPDERGTFTIPVFSYGYLTEAYSNARLRFTKDILFIAASPETPLEIRRQRNSKLPVNRIPQEVLIMIATSVMTLCPGDDYMTLICLTRVCSQWRRTITTCPTLWTDISLGGLGMSGSLANMFFERAEGCNMDVKIAFRLDLDPWRPISLSSTRLTIPMLSSKQRIRTLSVGSQSWDQFQDLISRWTGALAPLEELELETDDYGLTEAPRSPIFVGEALKRLKLEGFVIPGLYNIKAPNLTVLKLINTFQTPCSVGTIFDFFDATPSLEDIYIYSNTTYDFTPPDREVTLSHLRRISLDTEHSHLVASRLICPSVNTIELVNPLQEDFLVGLFPQELLSLLEKYSVEAFDEVFMRVSDWDEDQMWSVQFCAPTGTSFCSTHAAEDLWPFPVLFDQAVHTLLSLPLGQVVALTICTQDSPNSLGNPNHVRAKLVEVLEKCSNLRKVVLGNYCAGCFPDLVRDTLPSIQTLVIGHPRGVSWEELVEYVTGVARTLHSRGRPLKRVEIFTAKTHPKMEQLEDLVQEVVYQEPASWMCGYGGPRG